MKVTLNLLALGLLSVATNVFAGDLKIPIPQRSVETPSQKLNREGVSELKHGRRDKAKRLFYKAYLLDPEDPFTLNNLGYVAELEGDADRALRYYALAAKDPTDAVIDQSSEASLKGKPLDAAYQHVQDSDHEMSRISEQAIVLLQRGRTFEARNLLRAELPRHPKDPFLLNNLGYTMESLGDLDGALRYYSEAASLNSNKRVIVTPQVKWRGRPISEVAAKNAAAVSELISRGDGVEAMAARLNLRGVVALNDNDAAAAQGFFVQAYKQDPLNAFTLNNLGYVTELEGDWEGAQVYYEAARSGHEAKDTVSYSTRREAEGEKVTALATDNQTGVQDTLKSLQSKRRRARQPVELTPRGSSSGNNDQLNGPRVPPVGIRAPALPPLPLPNSDQRNAPKPNPQPPDSAQPKNPPPDQPH